MFSLFCFVSFFREIDCHHVVVCGSCWSFLVLLYFTHTLYVKISMLVNLSLTYRFGYYVSITSGFYCIDIHKFFIPYGETDVKPTCQGIALRLREWGEMRKIDTINNTYQSLATALPCYLSDYCQSQIHTSTKNSEHVHATDDNMDSPEECTDLFPPYLCRLIQFWRYGNLNILYKPKHPKKTKQLHLCYILCSRTVYTL